MVRSLLAGHRQLLQSPRDSGEDSAKVVQRKGEEDFRCQVPQLVTATVCVPRGSVTASVKELADLTQQEFNIHSLVIFYLDSLRAETLLQGVQHYQQGLVVVTLKLCVGGAQLINPLQDLSQARYHERELELGDLYQAFFVLLDIDPGVMGLWTSPAWQLVLKPRDQGRHPLHGFLGRHARLLGSQVCWEKHSEKWEKKLYQRSTNNIKFN